jgi:hypothetical protein
LEENKRELAPPRNKLEKIKQGKFVAMTTVYHGADEPDFKPIFAGGREYHDYGNVFYATEDIEATKEWACQGQHESAFVYVYELESDKLNCLNLDKNNALKWVSVLMTHRCGKKIRGAALELCRRMIERYGVDVSGHDLSCRFRADNFSVGDRLRHRHDYARNFDEAPSRGRLRLPGLRKKLKSV